MSTRFGSPVARAWSELGASHRNRCYFRCVDISKDIEPVTTLKRDAATLIERARESASPIVITQHGKPTAVLQDVETYVRQRKALLLLKLLAEGERDCEAGRVVSNAAAKRRLRKRLTRAE